MKVNVLRITASLSLLVIGVFACEPSPALDSSSPTLETEAAADEPFLPIISDPLLPPLSETELETLMTELTTGIDTWFGLAGLDKVVAPPRLPAALVDLRAVWGAINPNVSTFIGSWYNSENYPYSVSIFPSSTPEQVCVLEFKPEWSLQIVNEATGETSKDVISEQILSFSIATVQNGHLRSSQVRSMGSATAFARYSLANPPYSTLFMSVMDDQGTIRVVAATSPPTLPAELPESLVSEVTQALSDYGCTMSPAPDS